MLLLLLMLLSRLRVLLQVVDWNRGELHVGCSFPGGISGLSRLASVREVELLVRVEDRFLVRWYAELGKWLLLDATAHKTRMRLVLVTAVR